MGYSCCICHKTARTGISMHRIPSVHRQMKGPDVGLLKERRRAWIRVIETTQVLDINKLSQYFVCSKHFVFGKPAHFRDKDNVDWIPTVGCEKVKKGVRKSTNLKTFQGEENTDANLVVDESSTNPAMDQGKENAEANMVVDESSTIPTTDQGKENGEANTVLNESSNELHSMLFRIDNEDGEVTILETDAADVHHVMAERIASLEAQLKAQNEHVSRLLKRVEKLSWTESTFEGDDKKVHFYTGLPNLQVLNLILSYIEVPLQKVPSGKSKCSNFQKLLLTLMKLRHNISYAGLSYRFDIQVRDASTIFKNVCVILFESFRYLIYWPSRECLKAKVPECFKEAYGDKVAIIIDYFEIRTETPANIRARAQTYSQYNAGITTKYLIGITQQGYISFVSEGYRGRVSDKFIAEDCGILKNLLPGDVVVADRGFTITEMVCMRDAKSNIPTITRGESQLQPVDIENTRKIASVRIYVERVIGLLRNKFTILKGTLPVNLLKARHDDKMLLDVIVSVCCMLTNMCANPLFHIAGVHVRRKIS